MKTRLHNLSRISRWLALSISASVLFLMPGKAAFAHPMGNFAICHYARFEAQGLTLHLRYLLDMAEIPTVTEKQELDRDHDGNISAEEQAAYLKTKSSEWKKGLALTLNGKPAELQLKEAVLQLTPGAGGLETLKITMDWQTPLQPGHDNSVLYRDENFPTRTGWKEIVVANGPGAVVREANAPSEDRSHELSVYPSDAVPPQQTEAKFTVRTGNSVLPVAAPGNSRTETTGNANTPRDAFTQAIASKQLTPGVMLAGLFLAFLFGSFHALSPGHGKAMVAAYLVGSRGTPKHAILLGIIVTITHTLGVFALGLITLFASRYIVPEKLYPVLSVVSGLSVFGVGVWLLANRARGLVVHHGHTHHDDHDHVHSHDHDHMHTHSYDHLHDHAHVHSHEEGHEHSHDHDHAHDHTHDHDHSHDAHGHVHYHSHGFGGHYHSHDLPEGPVTAKALLALGVSGGIVPCPSALVVLLSAIALHRVAYGMALITAFSFGLAAVLIVIGLAVVLARGALDRVPSGGALMQRLPVASAAAITLIGVILVVRALGIG